MAAAAQAGDSKRGVSCLAHWLGVSPSRPRGLRFELVHVNFGEAKYSVLFGALYAHSYIFPYYVLLICTFIRVVYNSVSCFIM